VLVRGFRQTLPPTTRGLRFLIPGSRLGGFSRREAFVPELEWPELQGALASLVTDVTKESDVALQRFLEWCTEYQCEIKAVALEGVRPLTDSSLDRFLGRDGS
jgi:hypothetical protein